MVRRAPEYNKFECARYHHRCLAEAQYRVNYRFDLASLVTRLFDNLVHTAPGPERWLRLAEIGVAEVSRL